MTEVITPPPKEMVDEELIRLAKCLKRGSNPAIQLLTTLGTGAETLLSRLPENVQSSVGVATQQALGVAYDIADQTRGTKADGLHWLPRALTAGTGAIGGFGGMPTALAELPVTTTLLLRTIQTVAAEHGIDPTTPHGKALCLQVFAAAGPLARDDGTDLSFLTLRLTVSGATVQSLIAQVAPRFAAALSQKLAAQAVPVLGAATGAAINYTFTSYYQEMARVQFGLLRLARESGTPVEDLTAQLKEKL